MPRVPRMLLIGAGRFGKHHVRVWQKLAREGRVKIVGIVVKRSAHARALAKETGLPVHVGLTSALLRSVDAVDIATPGSTHAALVRRCLPFADVFVEKPLAERADQARALVKCAKKYRRVLFVGHIYRFHPLTRLLRRRIKNRPRSARITGRMISPAATWRGQDPALEHLHWFDVLDALGHRSPDTVWVAPRASGTRPPLVTASLAYAGNVHAELTMGWRDDLKERTLTFSWLNETWDADFQRNCITVTRGSKRRVLRPPSTEPIEAELRAFVASLRTRRAGDCDAATGARIVEIAERCRPVRRARPTVAVIGGGIFGLTAALELADRYQVTVFERGNDIMEGASRGNQYRHHWGYHYPRSMETIREVRDAAAAFQKRYGRAVLKNAPSYYAVSREESYVTPRRFMDVCRRMKLPMRRAFPPRDMLDPSTVSLCVKTAESVFDYDALKRIIHQRVTRHPNITVRCNHRITDASLDASGQKNLTVLSRSGRRKMHVDYVVNATYANYNAFCGWLGFLRKDLELRFKELIILRLPKRPPTAVTIMDGPFATLVPIGRTGLYTFGDVPLSVHATASGAKGDAVFDALRAHPRSRWKQARVRCLKWFPVLRKATYISSMYAVLPVERDAAQTDARPTEVTPHGFGCWSLFSGKVITSAAAAEELVRQMAS